MADTKERILTIALQLFSREGYEAVSMRMIADALGITKGALYKHYESKRDIFDHIVARMRQADAQRAQEYAGTGRDAGRNGRRIPAHQLCAHPGVF